MGAVTVMAVLWVWSRCWHGGLQSKGAAKPVGMQPCHALLGLATCATGNTSVRTVYRIVWKVAAPAPNLLFALMESFVRHTSPGAKQECATPAVANVRTLGPWANSTATSYCDPLAQTSSATSAARVSWATAGIVRAVNLPLCRSSEFLRGTLWWSSR